MLLFVPCTSRKRIRPSRTLQASRIQHRSLAGYAKHWAHEVRRSEKVVSARDLYAGQSVSAAFAAEDLFNAKLHFVSAGLGVIKATTKVPAYDLTIVKTGPGPFCNLDIPYEPHRWWDLLNGEFGKTEPIANLVRRNDAPVIMALSATYLSMIEKDVLTLSDRQIQKIRLIVTPNVKLHKRLIGQAIEYDARVNQLKGSMNGSMASLIQRSALHFISLIHDEHMHEDAATHRNIVQQVLSAAPAPMKKATRMQKTDVEIQKLIVKMPKTSRKSASQALRTLREEYFVACEHKRFQALFHAINATSHTNHDQRI